MSGGEGRGKGEERGQAGEGNSVDSVPTVDREGGGAQATIVRASPVSGIK